ncbi:MAG: hypothetical protein ICV67_05420 [Thermoleophilia bacterium]|nr:hypothetical protein [Thermoleophilia bacterium]
MLDAMVEVVLARRVRVHGLAPALRVALEQLRLDFLLAHDALPEGDHMLVVAADVAEVADPDADPVATPAEEPREEMRLEDAGTDDTLLGKPLDAQRPRRNARERSQDRVEPRRPHARQGRPKLTADPETRQQVVVNRLSPRDRRDRPRLLRQVAEHRGAFTRIREATERHAVATLSR